VEENRGVEIAETDSLAQTVEPSVLPNKKNRGLIMGCPMGITRPGFNQDRSCCVPFDMRSEAEGVRAHEATVGERTQDRGGLYVSFSRRTLSFVKKFLSPRLFFSLSVPPLSLFSLMVFPRTSMNVLHFSRTLFIPSSSPVNHHRRTQIPVAAPLPATGRNPLSLLLFFYQFQSKFPFKPLL
jgi:hypothetical protein